MRAYLLTSCPDCGARPGIACRRPSGLVARTHRTRVERALIALGTFRSITRGALR